MGTLDQILKALKVGKKVNRPHPAYEWLSKLKEGQAASDPTPIKTVDVVIKLERDAADYERKHHIKLNWRVSIVDLLALLDIDDRNRKARDELARELGCPAELKSGSDVKNAWLHKRVLKRIAENGGDIPRELFEDLIKPGVSSSIIISKFNQTTEITINGRPGLESNYITWAPVPCEIRLADKEGVTKPIVVTLRNQNPKSKGGQVVFFASIPVSGKENSRGKEHDELKLSLHSDGTPVKFFIAGKFGNPSIADKDAVIEVVETRSENVLSRTPLMVRIRKNANTLTDDERDRFLAAIALLELADVIKGEGVAWFDNFGEIHRFGWNEAHGNAGFLPWHRAFLLDLERALQAIDPSVTLPYWRFDKIAPNLFSNQFIGVPNKQGTLDFSESNPLRFISPPIIRIPKFDTNTAPANEVFDERKTIEDYGVDYAQFISLESNPHGNAHTSFQGFLPGGGTAAMDPLFFMLHANVDRLWAKWQKENGRFDINNEKTYPKGEPDYEWNSETGEGIVKGLKPFRIGHNLGDTMWPWNQIMGKVNPFTGDVAWDDRPETAPGGNFPDSAIVNFPGLTPMVGDMIDYQGAMDSSHRLGFDYDDVPYYFEKR